MSGRCPPSDYLYAMMKLLISLQFVVIRKGEQTISRLLMMCCFREQESRGEEILSKLSGQRALSDYFHARIKYNGCGFFFLL